MQSFFIGCFGNNGDNDNNDSDSNNNDYDDNVNNDNGDNDDDYDSNNNQQVDDEDCEEEDGGCHPRMLHGDNRLVQFNLQSNSWTNRGYLGRNTHGALQLFL